MYVHIYIYTHIYIYICIIIAYISNCPSGLPPPCLRVLGQAGENKTIRKPALLKANGHTSSGKRQTHNQHPREQSNNPTSQQEKKSRDERPDPPQNNSKMNQEPPRKLQKPKPIEIITCRPSLWTAKLGAEPHKKLVLLLFWSDFDGKASQLKKYFTRSFFLEDWSATVAV